MGFWSSTLYGNDYTLDIRDSYIQLIQDKSAKEVFRVLKNEYLEKGNMYEPLFWYAIADVEKDLGIKNDKNLSKALSWINKKGGITLWTTEDDINTWQIELDNLRNKLLSENKKPISIKKRKSFTRNPWNVGDFYAYCFNSEESKQYNLYKKYIVIQKIADQNHWEKLVFSRVQILNRIFSNIPTIDDLIGIPILPLLTKYDDETGELSIIMDLDMDAYLNYEKEEDYVKEHYTYIGNKEPIAPSKPWTYTCLDFKDLEQDLIVYYLSWAD